MPHTTTRSRDRPSGGERVFADDGGLLWSASHRKHSKHADDGVVVFACITDSRQSVRAMAVDATFRIADVSDDALREWLRAAPRIGRLT